MSAGPASFAQGRTRFVRAEPGSSPKPCVSRGRDDAGAAEHVKAPESANGRDVTPSAMRRRLAVAPGRHQTVLEPGAVASGPAVAPTDWLVHEPALHSAVAPTHLLAHKPKAVALPSAVAPTHLLAPEPKAVALRSAIAPTHLLAPEPKAVAVTPTHRLVHEPEAAAVAPTRLLAHEPKVVALGVGVTTERNRHRRSSGALRFAGPIGRMLLMALALSAAGAAAQGRVVGAGSLKDARTNHTATLLNDGRVLVVGGRGVDALSTLASVELYNPKTKKWSPAAPLPHGRSHHTATLLNDGRVLVVGGTTHEGEDTNNRFAAVAWAEVYDPKKNTWATAASLGEPRNGHTATLLNDGRVLVAGGAKAQRAHLASVELFDPAAGTWSPGPPLNVPRWQHEAVRLANGSVVVVAGRSNRGQPDGGSGLAVADVETFVDGGWQVGPPLNEPRQRGATVSHQNEVTVIGGISTTTATNYVETWSPGAALWSLGDTHLSRALSAHTATALPAGDLLVVGGEPPNAVDSARVQRWSHAQSKWCSAGQLLTPRKGHTATLLNDGQVLVVGGTSAGVPEASAELWQATKGPCEEPGGLGSEP